MQYHHETTAIERDVCRGSDHGTQALGGLTCDVHGKVSDKHAARDRSRRFVDESLAADLLLLISFIEVERRCLGKRRLKSKRSLILI